MRSPLSKASQNCDVEKIRSLLSQGIDVNERSKGKYPTSAIHWAANSGCIEAVTLLLQAGASVNTRDYCDQTPLIWAANGNYSHKSRMVSFLISKGADVGIVDCHGWSIFNYADSSEDKSLIESLTEKRIKAIKRGIDNPDYQPYKPTIDYKNMFIDIQYHGAEKIVFAVHDKRPYVISGEKKQDYVGYFRKANYGQPYDATTPNKIPLSNALSLSVIAALRRSGYDVDEVNAIPSESNRELIEKMKQFRANKLVILTLLEWLSEAYYNVGFTYDISLLVMDENGVEIGAANIKGADDLGDPAWVPEMRAKNYVPEAAKNKIETLFNKQEIKNSFMTK